MQIAHCSDLHLLSLEGVKWLDFANKRWIGGLNLLTSRAKDHAVHVFEAMIDDLNESPVNHVVCTGDVTNLALQPEFRFARALFDRLTLGPRDVTVLPGNHDTYVARGAEYFRAFFADYYQPDDDWGFDDGSTWPSVRVRDHVAVISISTSLATPWFTAYGKLETEQLERLHAVLSSERLAGKLRLLAIHHPPTGAVARNRVRGLRGWRGLAEVLADAGAELVLHGHEHRDLYHEMSGPGDQVIPVMGIHSGTYQAHRPERTARYRVFDISDEPAGPDGRPVVLDHRLRIWDATAGRFVDDLRDEIPRGDALEERDEARPGL